MRNYGKSVFDLDANIVAMLCYLLNFVCILGLVLSIITLVQDKTNKLARFHAWQSISLSVVFILLAILYLILSTLLISAGAYTLIMIISWLPMIVGLAAIALEIFLAVKAYQGEIYRLPIIGELADKNS
ncbi:MAG: DUF4870 domain-containing protein [Acidobacteria bacterium]|jgi:uncharacterized membrane protein|nr:MAG: DUF4870 domain-containing protein [Acidobacteriota bacterium]GIU82618.1 MAG: membrane protein [Pyrinomonadaceae bacterium]